MSKNNYVHIYANICPIKTWEFLYASTQDFVSEKYVPFAGITLKRRLSADWLRFLCRTPNDAKPF
jgi:hypothetical protein